MNNSTVMTAVYTIAPTAISSVAVHITAPAKGAFQGAASTADAGYVCGAVTWTPNDNPFKGSETYTAKVTLTANSGYTFTGLVDADAHIDGKPATVSDKSSGSVTLSYTFSPTLAKAVTNIAYKSGPTKLLNSYTHGDTLNLAGLEVTITFDEGPDEDVLFANFGTYGITTIPAHGDHLVHLTHDNGKLELEHGNLNSNVEIGTLTVAKANHVVTWPTGLTANLWLDYVAGTASVKRKLSDVPLTSYTNGGTGAFTWVTPTDELGGLGSRTHSMAFTPDDTANYNTPAPQGVAIAVRLAEMVSLPPTGTPPFNFQMGQTDISLASPVRQITLTKGFYMGKYQVTQEQYQEVMGVNPSSTTAIAGEIQGKLAVNTISWYRAIAFCNRLSILEGLTPVYGVIGIDFSTLAHSSIPEASNTTWDAATQNLGANGYRLPTEAEWEYACRAGTTTVFSFGDADTNLGTYAWFSGTSQTHEVGKKEANPWGLYDIYGNVWEWCWDWYNSTYYYSSPPNTDPTGPATKGSLTQRTSRGGSSSNVANSLRSAHRDFDVPELASSRQGFRIVRGL